MAACFAKVIDCFAQPYGSCSYINDQQSSHPGENLSGGDYSIETPKFYDGVVKTQLAESGKLELALLNPNPDIGRSFSSNLRLRTSSN